MGYTAMQGGLSAIKAAEDLVRRRTLGRRRHALDPSEVAEKMSLGVDRVMSEGGLYDPAAAAVALVQAEGDLHEASFIVRAYRSTLPRIAYSIPTDTGEMRVLRRITPAFQFAPGGQLLGATRDYTQRLLDWRIAEPGSFAEDQAEPDACRAEPPVFTRIAVSRTRRHHPEPARLSGEPFRQAANARTCRNGLDHRVRLFIDARLRDVRPWHRRGASGRPDSLPHSPSVYRPARESGRGSGHRSGGVHHLPSPPPER